MPSRALIAAGEWFRRSERALPVEAIPAAHVPGILTAAGTASLFGSVYAAYGLYQFIGPAAAFVALGAIGVATMFAAALHGPALAGLGLAGALAVPLLIESQEPSPWPLVIYLAVVAAAAYALARLRRWLWLAAAVVAGAFVWGLALIAPVGGTAAQRARSGPRRCSCTWPCSSRWPPRSWALEPHLGVADDAAEPDWIAGAALAALGVLAVLALDASAPTHGSGPSFAAVALAILAATAWRSAPAAPPRPRSPASSRWRQSRMAGPRDAARAAPAGAGAGRRAAAARQRRELPRLRRRSRRSSVGGRCRRCASGADGACRSPPPASTRWPRVVPPLLALVLAYLRVTQFDRSISFSLIAVALAGVFYFAADRFHASPPAEQTPATHLATGAFASGVAAAMSLAFVMVLDRGYLTVAFAVTAATTADLRRRRPHPAAALRGGRHRPDRARPPRLGPAHHGRRRRHLADPQLAAAGLRRAGAGVPDGAATSSSAKARTSPCASATRWACCSPRCSSIFQIRHALNGGDPLAPTSGHVEQGLFALTSLGFAAVLIRIDRGAGQSRVPRGIAHLRRRLAA